MKLKKIKSLFGLLLILPTLVIADTPPQVINKLCAPNEFFSQIQPGPNNIQCTQPSYSGLSGLPNFINSVNLIAGNVSLVNDSSSPGVSKYYGTNGGGTKGYFSLPSTVAWGNITGTLSSQTDLQSALNAKQNTLTEGNLIESTSSVLTITGGTNAVIGSGTAIQVKQAGASQSGYLSSADWNTFNNGVSGNFITSLTGDVTGSGSGAVATTLASTLAGDKNFTGSVQTASSLVGTAALNGSEILTVKNTKTTNTALQGGNFFSSLAFNGNATAGNSALTLLADRTITASNSNDASGSLNALSSNLQFTVPSGQALTRSAVTSPILLPTLSAPAGTLAITTYSKIRINADAVNTGSRKAGIIIQPQTGASNNAAISDNAGWSGNLFISQTGTEASSFGGPITASNFSGSSSGTNTGDVSIGTANGLSLAGQVLSLQQADATHTGALTAADWNSFSAAASGNFISDLTGDVTATGPGSSVATLASTIAGNKVFTGSLTASNLTGTNSGDVTLSAVGASPDSNGATLSGQALTLQPADATHPGLITSGSQTIGGAKTFASTITASNLSGSNSGDVSLNAVGSSPNSSGASLSSQSLTLQPADGSNPGLLTSGTQTIGGNKTLTGSLTGTTETLAATDSAGTAITGLISTASQTQNAGISTSIVGANIVANRTITTSQSESTGAMDALILNNSFTVPVGQTLTRTTTTAPLRFPTVTAPSGTLQISQYSKIRFDADTVNTGTRKNFILFNGALSGATNNAFVSDNTSYTGNYVFHFTSTNPSSFAGSLTASNLSGTNTGDVSIGTANGLSLVGQVLSLSSIPDGALAISYLKADGSRTLTGPLIQTQQATPSNPPSGSNKLYFKSDGNLYILDSAGSEIQLGNATGGVTGPGSSTNNAIATWNGTSGTVIQDSTVTIAGGNLNAAGTLAGSNFSGSSSGANTGDVTLGTANGLSLAGQALSIQLSDATHTGALSSADWNTFNSAVSGNYITDLTGDATASGPGSVALTLATVASGATVGSSTSIPTITFNNKGLVTSASGNAVIAPAGTLTGTTLASNVVSSSLTTLGAIAQALLPDANNTRDLGSTGTRWANLWLGGNATVTGNVAATGTLAGSNFSGSSSGTNTGDVTLTAVGSTPSANAASLAGQALTLQPADGSNPGVITSGTQTIGGNKTFSGSVQAANFLAGTSSLLGTELVTVSNSNTANTALQGINVLTSNGFNGDSTTAGTGLNVVSNRTITTSNSNDSAGGLNSINANLTFTVPAAQTLTRSALTNVILIPTLTAPTGTLAISTLSKIRIAADSVNTGTRKIGLSLLAQTGATNNAAIADNASFTGNYFINQSGTDASSFGGSITASNLSGTNTGDVTLAAVGSSPSANGASLSSQVLTLQPADATHPGLLTILAQSIAGAKTFSGLLQAAAGILGVADGSNAAAGNIGEYKETLVSTPTAWPCASNVWCDMSTLSLTAGDWDVTNMIAEIPNGATLGTLYTTAISVNSGVTITDQVDGVNQAEVSIPAAGSNSRTQSIPTYRINVSGTTTIYSKALLTYSVATPNYQGRISARRSASTK